MIMHLHSISNPGRKVVFSDAQARKRIFESACTIDVEEFGKFSRYNHHVAERRGMFVERTCKYMRRRFFGGLTRRYILHVLMDMMKTRGDDFVREMLSERCDDPVWMDWSARLVNMKAVVNSAADLAEELQELALTTAQRGKILGEFAAKLVKQVDELETPSPFSHEVCVHTF